MQSLISARSHEGAESQKWMEFVQDLWTEERLKHLRDFAVPYSYDNHSFQFDPATQMYGFQEGVEEESFLFIDTDPPGSLEENSENLTASAEEMLQPTSQPKPIVTPPSMLIMSVASHLICIVWFC